MCVSDCWTILVAPDWGYGALTPHHAYRAYAGMPRLHDDDAPHGPRPGALSPSAMQMRRTARSHLRGMIRTRAGSFEYSAAPPQPTKGVHKLQRCQPVSRFVRCTPSPSSPWVWLRAAARISMLEDEPFGSRRPCPAQTNSPSAFPQSECRPCGQTTLSSRTRAKPGGTPASIAPPRPPPKLGCGHGRFVVAVQLFTPCPQCCV